MWAYGPKRAAIEACCKAEAKPSWFGTDKHPLGLASTVITDHILKDIKDKAKILGHAVFHCPIKSYLGDMSRPGIIAVWPERERPPKKDSGRTEEGNKKPVRQPVARWSKEDAHDDIRRLFSTALGETRCALGRVKVGGARNGVVAVLLETTPGNFNQAVRLAQENQLQWQMESATTVTTAFLSVTTSMRNVGIGTLVAPVVRKEIEERYPGLSWLKTESVLFGTLLVASIPKTLGPDECFVEERHGCKISFTLTEPTKPTSEETENLTAALDQAQREAEEALQRRTKDGLATIRASTAVRPMEVDGDTAAISDSDASVVTTDTQEEFAKAVTTVAMQPVRGVCNELCKKFARLNVSAKGRELAGAMILRCTPEEPDDIEAYVGALKVASSPGLIPGIVQRYGCQRAPWAEVLAAFAEWQATPIAPISASTFNNAGRRFAQPRASTRAKPKRGKKAPRRVTR